jgi:hypothetical protein
VMRAFLTIHCCDMGFSISLLDILDFVIVHLVLRFHVSYLGLLVYWVHDYLLFVQ